MNHLGKILEGGQAAGGGVDGNHFLGAIGELPDQEPGRTTPWDVRDKKRKGAYSKGRIRLPRQNRARESQERLKSCIKGGGLRRERGDGEGPGGCTEKERD